MTLSRRYNTTGNKRPCTPPPTPPGASEAMADAHRSPAWFINKPEPRASAHPEETGSITSEVDFLP